LPRHGQPWAALPRSIIATATVEKASNGARSKRGKGDKAGARGAAPGAAARRCAGRRQRVGAAGTARRCPARGGAASVARSRAGPGAARLPHRQRSPRVCACIYVADFIAAHDECLRNGFALPMQTASGGSIMRANPALKRCDTAAAMVIELASRFGMSPTDRYRLFSMKARAPDDDPLDGGLLERPAARAAGAPGRASGEAESEAAARALTRWTNCWVCASSRADAQTLVRKNAHAQQDGDRSCACSRGG